MSSPIITDFEKLYDSYSPAVFGMISACVNDRAVANDILVDVFTKYFYETKDKSYNFSLIKLLSFARKTLCVFINENRHRTGLHPQIMSCEDLIDERMLQLICLGKHRSEQEKPISNNNGNTLSRQLSSAIKDYRSTPASV